MRYKYKDIITHRLHFTQSNLYLESLIQYLELKIFIVKVEDMFESLDS